MARKYWLMKSEPETYSFEDLQRDGETCWDGVRNYSARNNMQEMKKGDRVFFYHSRQDPPGIVGIAEVVRTAYPDPTQFDEDSRYYDEKANRDDPRWFMVDIAPVEPLPALVSLHAMKENPKLDDMAVTRKFQRVSVLPVTKEEWDEVLRMARAQRDAPTS